MQQAGVINNYYCNIRLNKSCKRTIKPHTKRKYVIYLLYKAGIVGKV